MTLNNTTNQDQQNTDQWAYKAVMTRLAQSLGHSISNDGSVDPTLLQYLNNSQAYNPTLALLDSWAVVVDILGFYQQDYIAKEAYLQKLTEERSIFELAKMVNVETRLAQSAQSWLTVSVQNNSISAEQGVVIPEGTQIQSLPANENYLPQIFETKYAYHLYPQWNSIKVFPLSAIGTAGTNTDGNNTDGSNSGSGNTDTGTNGTGGTSGTDPDAGGSTDTGNTNDDTNGNNTDTGNQSTTQLVSSHLIKRPDESIEKGQKLLINKQLVATITKVDEPEEDTIKIYWEPAIETSAVTDLQLFTKTTYLFGYQAAEFDSLSLDERKDIKLAIQSANDKDYGSLSGGAFTGIEEKIKDDLETQIAALEMQMAVLKKQAALLAKLVENDTANAGDTGGSDTGSTDTGTASSQDAAAELEQEMQSTQQVIDELKAALGNVNITTNLQSKGYLSGSKLTLKFANQKQDLTADLEQIYQNHLNGIQAIFEQAYYADVVNAEEWIDIAPDFLLDPGVSEFCLDEEDEKISSGTYVALIQAPESEEGTGADAGSGAGAGTGVEESIAAYQIDSIAEKVVAKYDLEDTVSCLGVTALVNQSAGKQFNPHQTAVHYHSLSLGFIETIETLEKSYFPEDQNADPNAGSNLNKTTLILAKPEKPLSKDQQIIVSGELAASQGKTAAELLTIADIEELGNYNRIIFTPAITEAYDPTTLSINANLIKVTHGETSEAILGSGDNSLAFQTFELPETDISFFDDQPAVVIRVNGIIWNPVQNFQGQSSSSRIYVIQKAPTGKWQVRFGDGVNGARLPSGDENITAHYRTGVGIAGNMPANRLTSLLTPITYVESLTNPVAIESGFDAGTIAQLVSDIPKKLRIMNRLLSEQDYMDYLSSKSEIAVSAVKFLVNHQPPKLKAIVVLHQSRSLTAVEKQEIHDELLTELRNLSVDDYYQLEVVIAEPQYFSISAEVKLNRVQETDITRQQERDLIIQNNIKTSLYQAYAIEQTGFDRPIYRNEIIGAIHAMPASDLPGATIDSCKAELVDKVTGQAADPVEASLIEETQIQLPWTIESIDDINVTII